MSLAKPGRVERAKIAPRDTHVTMGAIYNHNLAVDGTASIHSDARVRARARSSRATATSSLFVFIKHLARDTANSASVANGHLYKFTRLAFCTRLTASPSLFSSLSHYFSFTFS